MKYLLALMLLPSLAFAGLDSDDWDGLHGKREMIHINCMREANKDGDGLRVELLKRDLIVSDSEATALYYFYCLKESTATYVTELGEWLQEERKAL